MEEKKLILPGNFGDDEHHVDADSRRCEFDIKNEQIVFGKIKADIVFAGDSITHFMEEAQDADRVIVLDEGKITADSTPKEVFGDISLLKSAGLDVPQTTELLYNLKKRGLDVKTQAISVEEAAKEIINALFLEENKCQ